MLEYKVRPSQYRCLTPLLVSGAAVAFFLPFYLSVIVLCTSLPGVPNCTQTSLFTYGFFSRECSYAESSLRCIAHIAISAKAKFMCCVCTYSLPASALYTFSMTKSAAAYLPARTPILSKASLNDASFPIPKAPFGRKHDFYFSRFRYSHFKSLQKTTLHTEFAKFTNKISSYSPHPYL